ncbi:NAD(P)H nitroreductase [Bacteroidales bacterium]|nr:NAD(P)H nitroreductase [Bacteroidales bacterium]
MSHFAEIIKSRRSIRKFTQEKLTPEQVEQLMATALMSPSSKHSNAWQFVLVEDKADLMKLSHCKSSGCSFVADCALAVVVLIDPLQSGAHIEDASIAATYLQLQAEDLGLGSCWIQVSGRETQAGQDSEEAIRELFDIPYQLVVACVIAIGNKEKPGKPFDEEKLQWEKIHIGKYV